jgi:hypothetical protein
MILTTPENLYADLLTVLAVQVSGTHRPALQALIDADTLPLDDIRHGIIRHRSPWKALAVTGVNLSCPSDHWPTIFDFAAAPPILTAYHTELAFSLPAVLCVSCVCPNCANTAPLIFDSNLSPLQNQADTAECPHCYANPWPWRLTIEKETPTTQKPDNPDPFCNVFKFPQHKVTN